MMPEQVRARLLARHGPPLRALPPDVVDEHGRGVVLAFEHRDRAAAEAYAAADRDVYGHPARAELRESVGWCCVVDLRPMLAEFDAAAAARR
jgi:hypothetical protein